MAIADHVDYGRVLIKGKEYDDLGKLPFKKIKEMLVHTHPTGFDPSDMDVITTILSGKRSSMIVFDGKLYLYTLSDKTLKKLYKRCIKHIAENYPSINAKNYVDEIYETFSLESD